MLSLLFSSLLLCLLTGFTRQARGDLISTDYDRYNSGKLGHRPHLDFVSSPEFAPMLQVNAWDEGAVSARGSHIFLRHDGNETALLASPLVLDARDLSAVYMNRSFANVFGTRVQDNWGTPYLTFWEGQKGDGLGDGWGLAYDQTYRLAYNVSTRNLSAHADLHEFALTGHGTALLTGVDRLTVETKEWRARGYRGPSRLQVLDAVFQEIDLETNEVLFDWRALDHIDPMDSYERWSSGWDIFHMNSIEKVWIGSPLSLMMIISFECRLTRTPHADNGRQLSNLHPAHPLHPPDRRHERRHHLDPGRETKRLPRTRARVQRTRTTPRVQLAAPPSLPSRDQRDRNDLL